MDTGQIIMTFYNTRIKEDPKSLGWGWKRYFIERIKNQNDISVLEQHQKPESNRVTHLKS